MTAKKPTPDLPDPGEDERGKPEEIRVGGHVLRDGEWVLDPE